MHFVQIPNSSSFVQQSEKFISTAWPKKVSHYQIIKISYQIVLKLVIEIRFIRQIKVSMKQYNIIYLVLNILRVNYFLTSITMPHCKL